MKSTICILILSTIMFGCSQPYQQPVYVGQPAAVVQQQVPMQQQADAYSPYQEYDNGQGGRVVYYTDPYLHTSYYLEAAMFYSLLRSPDGYYGIHNYYLGHRSFIDHNYTVYHNTYHHVSYDSRTDNGARYRRSVPNNPRAGTSQSSTPNYRPSVPTGRNNSPAVVPTVNRASMPTGRTATSSVPTYTPSRPSMPTGRSSSSSSSSSSGSRRSMPSGRH